MTQHRAIDLLHDHLLQYEQEAAAARANRLPDVPDLLTFVTSPEWCGFETASPVQLAILRLAAGLEVSPETTGLTREQLRFHFEAESIPAGAKPSTVIGNGGVRGGKSLLAALVSLVHGSLVADMSNVRPGEYVRGLIVAPGKELSAGTFAHVLGTLKASPILSRMIAKETVESCVIRRPDGIEVTIKLVAASSGGKNLRSTWLTGVVFDEADFHDDEDAAVNLDTNRDAAAARLLPGSQEWVVSSPWADTGPFYELVQRYKGKPHNGCVAWHSNSRAMNPTLDPKREAEMRARDPEKAQREYDAIPLSSGGVDFFPATLIDACMVEAPGSSAGVPHFGGVDFGFRKNSSALALSRAENVNGRMVAALSLLLERRPTPSEHLVPSKVVREFAETCHAFRCSTMRGDLHYADTAHDELAKIADDKSTGVTVAVSYDEFVPSQDTNAELMTQLRTLMLEGKAFLGVDPVLRLQLKGTRMRPMPGGKMSVQLPKRGQTHGDVLVAVALSLTQVPLVEPDQIGDGIFTDGESRYDGMNW